MYIQRFKSSHFEHQTNSNVFIYLLVIELKHTIFGFEQTNIKPNRAFTWFTKLLIEHTRTSFFQTLNELKHVHLFMIELEHPIFGLQRTNIEPNRAFVRFTKLLIELTRTSFCMNHISKCQYYSRCITKQSLKIIFFYGYQGFHSCPWKY